MIAIYEVSKNTTSVSALVSHMETSETKNGIPSVHNSKNNTYTFIIILLEIVPKASDGQRYPKHLDLNGHNMVIQ